MSRKLLYTDSEFATLKCEKTTIMAMIFRDFLMFYQIFFSSEVKQCVIISNKHGIYELPNNLSNV